eukprot:7638304-Alexandrium_andersonii.AAC.1
MHSLARVSKCDVQANEGANRLIKLQAERSSNLGLPLLDSRVRMTQALSMSQEGNPTKWSSIRPHAQQ